MTLEEQINEFVQAFQQASTGRLEDTLATDRLIDKIANSLMAALPGYDPHAVGEICVRFSTELVHLACAMTEAGRPLREILPIVLNTAGVVGARLYRAAELGADWTTTNGDT